MQNQPLVENNTHYPGASSGRSWVKASHMNCSICTIFYKQGPRFAHQTKRLQGRCLSQNELTFFFFWWTNIFWSLNIQFSISSFLFSALQLLRLGLHDIGKIWHCDIFWFCDINTTWPDWISIRKEFIMFNCDDSAVGVISIKSNRQSLPFF